MKQAVVIVHGMGEQIPMGTLDGFVETVWSKDPSLVPKGKPDANTGGPRRDNASWGKPDERTRSYEVRRITTESDKNRTRTDFYEYYWAHLMHGTTWEHVWAWMHGLLFRDPFSRVPPRLRLAWGALWAVTLAGLAIVAWGMLRNDPGDRSPLETIFWGFAGLAATAALSNILLKRFGDIARYVSATPLNVDRRQEIRESGVDLLQTLIESKEYGQPEYDRIIVVGHSLGTIIAYDILTQLFARKARTFDMTKPQPEREKLEDMIRQAAGLLGTTYAANSVGSDLDLEVYQVQQARAAAEAQAAGAEWPITDFITLGSPLAHAEFLMAEDRHALRDKQLRRILPTCPPVLEFDASTGLRHFTYGPGKSPSDPRRPHHGAMFAYTRWTNIYSDHAALLWGDIISGPVGEVFGLESEHQVLIGARDIAVLPAMHNVAVASGMRRPLLTHTKYWNMQARAEALPHDVPHHIDTLRKALRLA